MWTSQVYGHHDKMARTKTHRTSQTRSIQRRNIPGNHSRTKGRAYLLHIFNDNKEFQ